MKYYVQVYVASGPTKRKSDFLDGVHLYFVYAENFFVLSSNRSKVIKK